MRRINFIAIMLFIIGLWTNISEGMFRQPQYIPIERLIENATAYIQQEPNDASGYYTLARIHYLAFVNKAFLVGAFGGSSSNIIPFWWRENYLSIARWYEATRIALEEYGYESTTDVPSALRDEFWGRVRAIYDELIRDDWQPEQPTTEQLIEHAGAAQWNFFQAAALDPNNGLYYLGQASLGEQYYEFFVETSKSLMSPEIKTIFLYGVKETYFLAYNLSIQEDLKLEYIPISGFRSIISYEAGNAYVRLWEEAEDQIPTEVQDRIADIKANLAVIEALPLEGITPIVFSLQENLTLTELLAPKKIVDFDLDGDGVVEKRPWVKPATGFLVWDGDGDGHITNGRELFGSVTWWLFFPNGYRAMDILDDNRDGFLSHGELDGISVWFDRNSNGCSDTGEIVPVIDLGITRIATRPNGFDGKSPMHTSGLQLKDGRTLPTYDWIAPSVSSSKETLAP